MSANNFNNNNEFLTSVRSGPVRVFTAAFMRGLSHRHTPIYYLNMCTVRDCAPKCTPLAAMAASEVARLLRSLLFSLRNRTRA